MKPDYAVIVTTPQEVSVIDAKCAMNMAKKHKIPFIWCCRKYGWICLSAMWCSNTEKFWFEQG